MRPCCFEIRTTRTHTMLSRHQDPIIAIATAPGRGAVGIVRISGKAIAPIMDALCGKRLQPRQASYLPFRDAQGQPIDQGQTSSIKVGLLHHLGSHAKHGRQFSRGLHQSRCGFARVVEINAQHCPQSQLIELSTFLGLDVQDQVAIGHALKG